MNDASDLPPIAPPGTAVGCLSNGGMQRYLLEAESTTGFVAWRLADGTTLISNSMEVSLPASAGVSFWSCAGYEDPSPCGDILFFDCHGNALTLLNVTALTALESLDCSFNHLTELALAGLSALENLDADNNQLSHLELRQLRHLRVLNCAGNQLQQLDLSGLDLLQILDCSNNRITSLHLDGCTSLQDARREGNPLQA